MVDSITSLSSIGIYVRYAVGLSTIRQVPSCMSKMAKGLSTYDGVKVKCFGIDIDTVKLVLPSKGQDV